MLSGEIMAFADVIFDVVKLFFASFVVVDEFPLVASDGAVEADGWSFVAPDVGVVPDERSPL